MTHATFPRVYVRKGTGPIIEYSRGVYISEGNLMRLSAQFGSEWRVWQEDWGRNAIDAHSTRTRTALPSAGPLTREELHGAADEVPFEMGSRFGAGAEAAPAATEAATP